MARRVHCRRHMYPTDDRTIRLRLMVREVRERIARIRALNAAIIDRAERAKKALAPLPRPE